MLALILAQLSTPLNLNGQPIYRAVCDGGITCSKSGTTLTINGSGSGSGGAPTDATYITQTPNATLTNEQALSANATGLMISTTGTGVVSSYTGSACGANQYATQTSAVGALTCAQVAYSQVAGTPTLFNQTVEDEATPLTQRATINFTGAGVTCVDSGGKTVCTISGGGGGSVNTASGTVTFGTGAYDATQAVAAAWVTGSSVITCKATGEEASVEGLDVTVISQGTGTFTVRAEPRTGTHTGALPFVCMGN